MKTPKRQLAIQDFKYRHESHIPVEISKGTDRHLTRQEWRDRRETCVWNLGEYVSLRQRQKWSQQHVLGSSGLKGTENYQRINSLGPLKHPSCRIKAGKKP